MGGAYADFAEDKIGSLEPGKFADLIVWHDNPYSCLLYTSDAADERSSVDLGGRRIIKKKTTKEDKRVNVNDIQ